MKISEQHKSVESSTVVTPTNVTVANVLPTTPELITKSKTGTSSSLLDKDKSSPPIKYNAYWAGWDIASFLTVLFDDAENVMSFQNSLNHSLSLNDTQFYG